MRPVIALLLALLLFSPSQLMADEGSRPSSYDEVSRDHWSYAAMDYLSKIGAVDGYPEGFFAGVRTLTGYEFACAIARVIIPMRVRGNHTACDNPIHLDVMVNDLKCEYEYVLEEISHQRNSTGSGSSATTDEDGAGSVDVLSGSAYAAVPIEHWSYAAMEYLWQLGVLEGYPEGYFSPNNTRTSDEFALAIARVYDVMSGSRNFADPEQYPVHVLVMVNDLRMKYKNEFDKLVSMPNDLQVQVEQDVQLADRSSSGSPTATAYDAIPLDHWAYPMLQYAQKSGWLPGYPEGYFDRDEALTQYEFWQAMARLNDTIDLRRMSLEQVLIVAALWGEFGANAEGCPGPPFKGVLADELRNRIESW